MEKKEIEILAPAGSYESMVAAVNAGADAVYIGGSRFGARAYANNLDEEAMIKAIRFVHLHGCKIYMTVNTLVKEKELPELLGYLKPYYEAGLDAVLVQDLGVFSYIHEHFPKLPLHISTQMTVTGKYSAEALKEMGAVRVVPARELSLKEIREIRQATGMEVETFVHGALCYCYSGQCLFSSLIGGRSGNRGRCAQTCRLPFDVLRDGKYLNRKDEKYVLSLKDLCSLDILPDILDAGVCSLKIEGRMKSPRYTAGVVSIYRKYVDRYLEYGRDGYYVEAADRRTLLELFDRGGQSEGYYKIHNGRDMVVLKEKPAFKETDQELFSFLDKTYVESVKKIRVRGQAYLEVGKPARLEAEMIAEGRKADAGNAIICRCEGDIPEEAKNAPMDEERIRKQFMKTGDSPFEFEKLDVLIRGNVFIPIQSLNRLRRSVLEELEKRSAEKYYRDPAEIVLEQGDTAKAVAPIDIKEEAMEFTALVNSHDQLTETISFMKDKKKGMPARRFGIYIASEEFKAELYREIVTACHEAGIFCYLMMPRIFRTEAENYFKKNIELLRQAGFDAVGVPSMEEPGFLKEQYPDIRQYFDFGMYTFNHLAQNAMRGYGADRTTIPVELNAREIEEAGLKGELIVYGYLPMMVSAQCIRRTEEGCSGKPELLYLKDRKGKSFPVRNQCRFCYNTIYNESPLSLKGLSQEIKKISPSALRLNFTIESGKETGRILRAFYEEFAEGKNTEPPTGNFTRGHFKRGVE